jgi:hypothetical protein
MQHLTFTEHVYDGSEAARFVASHPDGWSMQTDPLGRELWLVESDGTTYDQIKTDAFYVETLEDFRAAIFEMVDREKAAAGKIDEVALADIVTGLKAEAAAKKLEKEQTVKAIGEGFALCYQIGAAVWQITCFLVMIMMVIGMALFTIMSVVCAIPLWFTGACLRGGWKMKRAS